MTRDPLEVLSAFLDGEVLEPELVARALASPGAREALVDFAALRSAIAADRSTPSPAFHRSMRRRLEGGAAFGFRGLRSAVLGFAAVLLLAVGIAAGFKLANRGAAGPHRLPPPATREVEFTRGVDWFARES